MAHSKQAKKRIRQNEEQREANRAVATRMKTEVKRVLAAIEAGDKAAAEAGLVAAMKRVDKAAKSNVIHENTAARKKSQLRRAINGMGG